MITAMWVLGTRKWNKHQVECVKLSTQLGVLWLALLAILSYSIRLRKQAPRKEVLLSKLFKVPFAPNAVTSIITSFRLWFVLLLRDMAPSILEEYSSIISEAMGVNPTECANFFLGFSQGSCSTCNFKDHSLTSSINIMEMLSAYSGFPLFHTCLCTG